MIVSPTEFLTRWPATVVGIKVGRISIGTQTIFMPENTPSNTLPDPNDTGAAGGDTVGTVDESVQEALRVQLGGVMGREFKNAQDALNAVKETKSFVGSVGQIRAAVKTASERLGVGEADVLRIMENIQPGAQLPGVAPQAPAAPSTPAGNDEGKRALALAEENSRQLQEFMFFQTRPELASQREALVNLAKITNKPLADVAEDPTIKPLLEKARAKDEADRSVSVLHSNPQVAAARNKMETAREHQAKGNQYEAEKEAVQAVIEAFGV